MAHFHTQQILGSVNTHVELCLLISGHLAAKTLHDAHQLVANFVCLLFDAELQVVKPTKTTSEMWLNAQVSGTLSLEFVAGKQLLLLSE